MIANRNAILPYEARRRDFAEHLTDENRAVEGHCQVGGNGACLPLDDSVPIIVQQAHVTAFHATNAWVRSSRW